MGVVTVDEELARVSEAVAEGVADSSVEDFLTVTASAVALQVAHIMKEARRVGTMLQKAGASEDMLLEIVDATALQLNNQIMAGLLTAITVATEHQNEALKFQRAYMEEALSSRDGASALDPEEAATNG